MQSTEIAQDENQSNTGNRKSCCNRGKRRTCEFKVEPENQDRIQHRIDQPRQLAADVPVSGQSPDVLLPAGDLTRFDQRLSQMVEHERLLRQ